MMRSRRARLVGVAVLALAAASVPAWAEGPDGAPAADDPAVAATAAGPATASSLRPLHAEHGASPRIADDLGRTVLLRGVNVNQLAEYAVNFPAEAPTLPLTAADFEQIAGMGFNVVRLLLSWSRLEPEPGRIDQAHLAEIRQAVDWAKANDLYVILDMHQDAWGPAVGTPTTETCLPGFQPAIGWDGAPAWATITDGLPSCYLQQRELSPAVAAAWNNFYLDRPGPDGVGIQTHLVAVWGAVAAAFADEPAVAGYDLLNEPNPGLLIGVNDLTLLGRFYGRAIAAIRQAEQSVVGGFSHPVFFEPGVLWSALAVSPTPFPISLDDTNTVFAPHIYAGSISIDRSFGLDLLQPPVGFALADLIARSWRVPLLSGEWAWFGDPATDGAKVAGYADLEDRYLASGTWWGWKQACGDPHQIGVRGASPLAVSPSLNRYGCPGNVPLGMAPEFTTVLTRSYVRASAGRLDAVHSHPATGALTANGTTEAPSTADVWVPDRGLGAPTVAGDGIDTAGAVIRPVAGGWRIAVPVPPGPWTLHLTPDPTAL